MRVLFIGDPHIRPDNIQEIDRLQSTVDHVLASQRVDLVVVGGDVLHTHERLHTIAMNRAVEFLKHLSTTHQVYCLVGNHDLINNQQFLSRNHWMTHMESFPNITIVDRPIRVEHGSDVFVMVPYVWPGRFKEAMEVCGIAWQDATCIFAHQEFRGCKMGAIVSEVGDIWCETAPLVISGHIHDNQRPQKNIYYPGTPIQHAFGDAGKNVVAIMDTQSGLPSIEEIYTECASKKTVSTSLEKIADLDLDKYTGTQLRVNVAGDATSLKVFQKSTKFKELQKAGVKVALKPVAPEMEMDVSDVSSSEHGDFIQILDKIVREEKNPKLLRDYEEIVLGHGDDSFEIL